MNVKYEIGIGEGQPLPMKDEVSDADVVSMSFLEEDDQELIKKINQEKAHQQFFPLVNFTPHHLFDALMSKERTHTSIELPIIWGIFIFVGHVVAIVSSHKNKAIAFSAGNVQKTTMKCSRMTAMS